MSTPPYRRSPDYPRVEGAPRSEAGERAQLASWLRHVEAQRRARVAAAGPEEARLRDIVLANERLLCGRQRTILD